MYKPENTISESKEESIAKAISLIQDGCCAKAPLHRPDISTGKILLSFALWLFATVLFLFLCIHLGTVFHIPSCISISVAVLGCLMIIAFKLKALVRNSVLLYQKHAPEKMRQSCLFTPSCSEYMLLAIEKYGVIVGTHKGLRRLGRCHHPNGGVDYP